MSIENSDHVKGNTKCIGSTAGWNFPWLSISDLVCPNICASFEIPTLEMDSSSSIGRRYDEATINDNLRGDFVSQSATTKLGELLDRGLIVDYVREFPHWILVTTRSGDASENSTHDRREKIDIDCFLNSAGFLIIDMMPQDIILLRSTL
jgi:hypothetical protein